MSENENRDLIQESNKAENTRQDIGVRISALQQFGTPLWEKFKTRLPDLAEIESKEQADTRLTELQDQLDELNGSDPIKRAEAIIGSNKKD